MRQRSSMRRRAAVIVGALAVASFSGSTSARTTVDEGAGSPDSASHLEAARDLRIRGLENILSGMRQHDAPEAVTAPLEQELRGLRSGVSGRPE